jgi:LacI family gluconate utilization system Gnt-I transcriptional repressor
MPRTPPVPLAVDDIPSAGRPLGVRDIARIAGVSPMSVSRALNAPHSVSEKTRARVQAAIESTGFVGNRLASGLAANRSGLVGLIVPAIAGPVFQDLVAALSSELATQGFHVMLGQAGYGVQREDELLEALLRRRPDGIILVGITPSPAGRQQLRRLAYVGASEERSRKRCEAFAAQACALGLEPPAVLYVDPPTTVRLGREALRALRERSAPAVDAVFCSSDILALGVLTELGCLGIAAGTQVALMGFGDFPIGREGVVRLSTVQVDLERMAQRAVEQLLAGPGAPLLHCDIGFRLAQRDT